MIATLFYFFEDYYRYCDSKCHSSSALTRELETRYLVQFFEDNESLVINRSRIFRKGRLVIDDTSNMQLGVSAKQSSKGKIVGIGDYSEMVQKLKCLKNAPEKNVKCCSREYWKKKNKKKNSTNTIFQQSRD